MAEQEIAKHGKNVIHLMTKKEHTLAHRLREVAIEIATIVFAVSMSIWLHGLSEHHHQQQEVRTFLAGLKGDLASDVRQITEMQSDYRRYDANYAYLASIDPGAAPDWKKFEDSFDVLSSNSYLIPTKSRYDGFLMSGKLTNIEDEQLLTDILNLYQSILPEVQLSEGGWSGHQRRLRDYRDEVLESDDRDARYRVLTSPKGKRLLRDMQTSPQLYRRYQAYIDRCKSIIRQIDAAYPDLAKPGARTH
jgi:hypothetical protein